MNRNAIMETIRSLALSQGFYGRLYRQLEDLDDETYDEVMQELEEKNFKDVVELVLFLEG